MDRGLRLVAISNGYAKFSATRGMEYLVDVNLVAKDGTDEVWGRGGGSRWLGGLSLMFEWYFIILISQ